ncbi:hypothetical protein NKG94_31400 [Micromonospora sp. M12]
MTGVVRRSVRHVDPADATGTRGAAGAAARGAGSPEVGAATTASGLETVLAEVDGEEGLFRIRVRGPSSCLAVWQRGTGSLRLTWQHQDGWSDSGDLIRVDDAGQVEVLHRASGEIGGLFLIPVAEIEDDLLAHPGSPRRRWWPARTSSTAS